MAPPVSYCGFPSTPPLCFSDCQAAVLMIVAVSLPTISAQLPIGTDDKFRKLYRLQITNSTNYTNDTELLYRNMVGYCPITVPTRMNRRSAQLQLLHWGGLPNYSSHHWLIQLYTLSLVVTASIHSLLATRVADPETTSSNNSLPVYITSGSCKLY